MREYSIDSVPVVGSDNVDTGLQHRLREPFDKLKKHRIDPVRGVSRIYGGPVKEYRQFRQRP